MDNGKKVAPEVAAEEVNRILAFFGLDPASKDFAEPRTKMLRAAEDGRLMLDEETQSVTLILLCPIVLENGKTCAEMSFIEPSAGDLKVIDRYKDNESMARTIHLLSKMTDGSSPIGVLERVKARDFAVMGAIAQLFF